ncbi:hypothetical protein [Infirmifilum sp. NZ]|uniref:hypothetical protein n=1 Tax=Infirmifilum sp. NZ TaxID=2926850 RepID=UPI0027A21C88|nr:hypothetical protein [Infirmifilum sp. NZ]UNQ73747.1 hypothetical protein MOV14_01730 [Infirmifilum sp. NZ]
MPRVPLQLLDRLRASGRRIARNTFGCPASLHTTDAWLMTSSLNELVLRAG